MFKHLVLIRLMLLLPAVFLNSSDSFADQDDGRNISVLVVTAKPERFDTEAFYEMVFSFSSLDIDTISQPLANHLLLCDSVDQYDAFLFFDMWQKISTAQKKAFLELTEKGKGMVFLHHSLVSYQEWDIFSEITGGRYYHDDFEWPQELYSTYRHDVILELEIIDPRHPVTKGIPDFKVDDEAYGNIEIKEKVVPLIRVDHPDNSQYAGWTNEYNNSRIVYLLPGQGPHVYSNTHYRQLIYNALLWSAFQRGLGK